MSISSASFTVSYGVKANFQAADHSRINKDQSSPEVQAFVDSIFDQFRNADIALAKRLGELNLDNRQRLIEGLTVSKTEKPAETHTRVSGFNSVVTFDESDEQVHVPIPFHHGDDWGFSGSSKSTRRSESNATVPPAPWQVQLEAPFKCMLCRKIVTLRGQEAWMIHVYADLSAYVCIHPACGQSFKYFHLWGEHVLTHHFPQVKRYCVFCNAEIVSTLGTSTRNAFVEHLVYNHWNTLSDFERTAATLDTEKFVLAPFNSFPCGICRRTNWKTWYDFAAHVARHLEEISLAALSDDLYPINGVSAMKNERLLTIRSRHSRKSQQDAAKERTHTAGSSLKMKEARSFEEEVGSDFSGDEDPDYVRIEHEPAKASSASIKKPHRGSLRPRKVRDKATSKHKEARKEHIEHPDEKNIHITHHVKFKDKERTYSYQKHQPSDNSASNVRSPKFQQSQQYYNDDPQPSHTAESSNPYHDHNHTQYEQPNLSQGYEAYRLSAAMSSPNYYRANFSHLGGVYDNRYLYQGQVNETPTFSGNCGCIECAALREHYA